MNMAASLRHPCLVQFLGGTFSTDLLPGQPAQPPMIVSELMATNLRRILPSGPLFNDLRQVAVDLAMALHFLHSVKPSAVIHRDVSSANVLLHGNPGHWRGKLSDLGSANVTHCCNTEGPGAALYSAPEATRPEEHSPKMDCCSFAVLLAEMFAQPWQLPEQGKHVERAETLEKLPLRALVKRSVSDTPSLRPPMSDILTVLVALK